MTLRTAHPQEAEILWNMTLRENYHHSRMAGADLRCFEMAIDL